MWMSAYSFSTFDPKPESWQSSDWIEWHHCCTYNSPRPDCFPKEKQLHGRSPWKINMKHSNHPFKIWKGKWSSQPLWLCSMLIFQGVHSSQRTWQQNMKLFIYIYILVILCHWTSWWFWNESSHLIVYQTLLFPVKSWWKPQRMKDSRDS